MIRIWNYNESRIATYKGVKKLAIYLDGRIVSQPIITKVDFRGRDPESQW